MFFFLCLMTKYKSFFQIKMSSSLLNISNDASSKSEEFSINDIEILVESEEQNWFKGAHVGKFLELVHIHRSMKKLADKDQKIRSFLKVEVGICIDFPREDAQDHYIFLSEAGALYVLNECRKSRNNFISLADILGE